MGNSEENTQLVLKSEISEQSSRALGSRATAISDCINNSSGNEASTSSASAAPPNLCTFCSKDVTIGDNISNLERTKMFETLCNRLNLDRLQFPGTFPKKLCTSCETKVMEIKMFQSEIDKIEKKIVKALFRIQDKVATDAILRPDRVIPSSDPFFEIRNAIWEGYKQRLRDNERQNSSPNPNPDLAIKDDVIEEEVEKIQEELVEISTDDDDDISAAIGVVQERERQEQLQVLPRDDYQIEIEVGEEEVGAEDEVETEEDEQESWAVGMEVIDQYLDSNSIPLIVNHDNSEEEEGREAASVASSSPEIIAGGSQEEEVVSPRKKVKTRARVTVPIRVGTRSLKRIKRELITRETSSEDEDDTDVNKKEENEIYHVKPKLRKLLFNGVEVYTFINAKKQEFMQCSLCSYNVLIQPGMKGENAPSKHQQRHIMACHPEGPPPPPVQPDASQGDDTPLPLVSSNSERVPPILTCTHCSLPCSNAEGLNLHEKIHRLRDASPRPALAPMNVHKFTPRMDVKKRARTPSRKCAATPATKSAATPARKSAATPAIKSATIQARKSTANSLIQKTRTTVDPDNQPVEKKRGPGRPPKKQRVMKSLKDLYSKNTSSRMSPL
ncbi:hypothetical protein Ocin01_10044 [Orchesella cincta]|uniref:C2H2-type domain-containing protein n=1 Tax=Orchesella cincta TaxID=48709 RepID=A0A1D2MUQ9_ORCCI|nr:hypothetical protein Ocin01_10044 [Orchesella cincta]